MPKVGAGRPGPQRNVQLSPSQASILEQVRNGGHVLVYWHGSIAKLHDQHGQVSDVSFNDATYLERCGILRSTLMTKECDVLADSIERARKLAREGANG